MIKILLAAALAAMFIACSPAKQFERSEEGEKEIPPLQAIKMSIVTTDNYKTIDPIIVCDKRGYAFYLKSGSLTPMLENKPVLHQVKCKDLQLN